jgi:hypothetical protein
VKKLMLKELQQHKSRYEQLKGWFDGEPDEVPRPATGFFPRSTIERNQVAAAQDVEASAGANNNNAENSDFEYYSYASDSADELIPQPSAPDVQIQRTAIINHDDATNSPFVPDKRLSISGAAEKRQEEPLTHTTTSHRRKTPSEQRAALAHSRKRDLTKGEKSNLDRKKMRMKILMDPKVRSQLVKKKIYDAFFLQLVTLVQILMLAYEIYINGGLESFSVNPFGGPSTLTLVQLGAKYVPCMRPDPMIIGNPEVTW